MALFWGVIGYVLWVYILAILARITIDWTRQFARSWRPAGAAAIGVEAVYSTTDPPIKALRRLVPPLQLGTVSLDLSVIILLIFLIVLRVVALNFA
ncbi:MAG: YggT family protein [Jatrophihabitans sp.]